MSIEKYDVKFVLLVDGVPCEFTVDGKTSYVHQYTVKSKNVFGFSFVPKTRGGDAFTVTLFAINSANPYCRQEQPRGLRHQSNVLTVSDHKKYPG